MQPLLSADAGPQTNRREFLGKATAMAVTAVSAPALLAAWDSSPAPTGPRAHFGKLSPVLVVDAVEPCLAFWTERLGFRQANAVPGEDGRLVFASAERDAVEIMYQSRASVLAAEPEATRPERARDLAGHAAALFIEVDDLDAIEAALAGAPVVKARHETFYGTAELYVREPGGTTVGFSMRLPAPPAPPAATTTGVDP